jgi:hypothetical protein
MKPTLHISFSEEGIKQLWVEDNSALLFETRGLDDPDPFVFDCDPPTLRKSMEDGEITFEWRPIPDSRLKATTQTVITTKSQQDRPKQSAFLLWFRAQHGPRPGGIVSDESLADLIRQGEVAKSLLQLRTTYDRQEQSALYAWQITDSKKSLQAMKEIVGGKS